MISIYKKQKQLILIVAGIAIALVALLINADAEFAGADGSAEELITVVNPDYTPWFSSVWEPPSGEIESLLFALQAAIGAAVLFYILGYFHGKSVKTEQK